MVFEESKSWEWKHDKEQKDHSTNNMDIEGDIEDDKAKAPENEVHVENKNNLQREENNEESTSEDNAPKGEEDFTQTHEHGESESRI